jgi:hypothetical protein
MVPARGPVKRVMQTGMMHKANTLKDRFLSSADFTAVLLSSVISSSGPAFDFKVMGSPHG